MSRNTKHPKNQERTNNESAMREGPKPIKVLAIGIGALLFIFAVVNMLFGSLTGSIDTVATTSKSDAAVQALGGALAPVNNGVQEVTVSMQGNQYMPNPIRVKVGMPVRFTVDLSTVRGCFRSIQIPELGVNGRVSEAKNIVEFTPTKAGTYRMTCGMGMADGTIIVEDENGQAPAATVQVIPLQAAGGGSCGSGSGGCGCGGG